MPITVKLNGGVDIHVSNADFDSLLEAFRQALADRAPLQIRVGDDRTIVVNPYNVLYFEAPSPAAAAANGNGYSTTAGPPAP